MHVNISGPDATDWASRAAAAQPQTAPRRDVLDSNEVMVRLFDLRGAVEVMRGNPVSATIGESRSSRGAVCYGDPAGYRAMRFLIVR